MTAFSIFSQTNGNMDAAVQEAYEASMGNKSLTPEFFQKHGLTRTQERAIRGLLSDLGAYKAGLSLIVKDLKSTGHRTAAGIVGTLQAVQHMDADRKARRINIKRIHRFDLSRSR
jgi:hypothetical protein